MSIQLVVSIIIITIMVISIGIGLLQGFRKNCYFLAATVLFWVVFWITAPWFTGNSLWFSESLFAALPIKAPDGVECKCVMDYIQYLLSNLLGTQLEGLSEAAVVNTLIAMVQCVLKVCYLFILGTIFLILSMVLYVMFFRKICVYNRKRLEKVRNQQEKYIESHNGVKSEKIDKEITKVETGIKHNKFFRPLGMASGFVRGALCSLLVVSMFNSFVRLLPDLSHSSGESVSTDSNNDGPKYSSLYDFLYEYLGDVPAAMTALDMIAEYQDSAMMRATGKTIGGKAIDDLLIDSILSGKSKDYSFVLREEISTFVQIAENAFYLTDGFDVANMNWTSLNETQQGYVKDSLALLGDDKLLNNLTESLIDIAVSLDAVKQYLPDELLDSEFADINLHDELVNVSKLVSLVYSLGDDLANLNWYELDEETVKEIFVTIGSMQSVTLLGHIGANLAVDYLVTENEAYAENVENIKKSLVDIAANNGFGEDIASYGDLYGEFVKQIRDIRVAPYKDENGNITNFLAALTAVDTREYGSLVAIVFESNFVSKILPDVLSILREQEFLKDYVSIINPSVLQSSQWEEEIDALLAIVHDISTDSTGRIHPFEKISSYDYSLLAGFSAQTVVQSDLLSYALIKSFIDISNNDGLLQKLSIDISDYICVPDRLAVEPDANYRYATKWYGTPSNNYKDGELYIMLDTIAKCASCLENISYPANSFPAMLATIDSTHLLDSDVLYFTVNKIVSKYQNVIIVPKDETLTVSEDTVKGENVDDMIKRSSLTQVLDVLTDSNIIDLKQLFVYYTLDEEGNASTEGYKLEDIPEGVDYIAKIDFSTDKVMGLLTSDSLYNPATHDDTNLDKLFTSGILRATLSNYLIEYAGEYIVIPSHQYSATNQDCFVVDGEGNKTIESKQVVTKREFKALLMAINDLDIDLSTAMNDPQSILDSIIDDSQEDHLKPCVHNIFGENGYDDSHYCGILHASMSKYLIDMTDASSNPIVQVMIPDEVMDEEYTNLIKPEETVQLLSTLAIVGTDVLKSADESDDTQESIIGSVIEKCIENPCALDSAIIRATLTDYFDHQGNGMEIVSDATDSTYASCKVITVGDANDMMKAIKAMKEDENTPAAYGYADLLNLSLIHINMIDNQEVYDSLVFRGVITQQIQKNEEIPDESFTDSNQTNITPTETEYVVNALKVFVGENSTVKNVKVDDMTVKQLYDANANQDVENSFLLRSILTKKLETASVVVPDDALEYGYITKEETAQLINGVHSMFNENDNVSALSTDNIKLQTIIDSESYIEDSLVLRASITKELKNNNALVIPTNALEKNDSKPYVYKSEIAGLVELLDTFPNKNQPVNNIELDTLTVDSLDSTAINKSYLLRATVSNEIKKQDGVVVVSEACDSTVITPNHTITLTTQEMTDLLAALKVICPGQIKNVDVDNLKVGTLYNNRIKFSNSLVMRATITDQLEDSTKNPDIVVTSDAVDDIDLISKQEIINLFTGLHNLLDDNAVVNNVKFDNLSTHLLNQQSSSLINSYILKASMSKKIINEDKLVIPYDSYSAPYIVDNELTALLVALDASTNGKTINQITDLLNATGGTFVDEMLGYISYNPAEFDRENDVSYASYIFRATATKYMIDNQDSVTISNGDLGLEEDYGYEHDMNANIISVIERVEFNNLLFAMRRIKGVSNTPINDLTSKSSLTYNTLSEQSEYIVASHILNNSISKEIIAKESGSGVKIYVPYDVRILHNGSISQYIEEDELRKFFKSMSIIYGEETVESLQVIESSAFFRKSDEEYNLLFSSSILLASLSSEVKNDGASNSQLSFLDGMYTKSFTNGTFGPQVLTYIDKAEMVNLFKALEVLQDAKGDNNLSFNHINISVEDDNLFLTNLSDDDVETVFASYLLSYNIREKLISSNTGTYFGGVLTLTQTIDNETATEALLEARYDSSNNLLYSTTGSSSDVCKLFKSIVNLKRDNYIDALTSNTAVSSLNKYLEVDFIDTMTEGLITLDSLPNIIMKINSNNNINTNFAILESDIRNFDHDYDASKLYYRGALSNRSDGELYRFISYIIACNSLITATSSAQAQGYFNTMLLSDIAFRCTDNYLAVVVPNMIPTLNPSTIPVVDGRRDYTSANGQAYIAQVCNMLY